ncbi:hypothetical protein BDN72DRAFT_293949 [Pluteus cervinus]|uniref:Uncharacterized protein n=1 Tax=Pluteus cervinus TaxID=181527 RepID=A0ACD3B4A1_9AGAR|nr:hypothetical protein BDN72DRAFT_293949 [Pluteus cervinus]
MQLSRIVSWLALLAASTAVALPAREIPGEPEPDIICIPLKGGGCARRRCSNSLTSLGLLKFIHNVELHTILWVGASYYSHNVCSCFLCPTYVQVTDKRLHLSPH